MKVNATLAAPELTILEHLACNKDKTGNSMSIEILQTFVSAFDVLSLVLKMVIRFTG